MTGRPSPHTGWATGRFRDALARRHARKGSLSLRLWVSLSGLAPIKLCGYLGADICGYSVCEGMCA